MKTINWKASAKTGSLMVNTFDSVQSQKAMIFLDVEDGGILKQEDLVEEGISIAATILRKLGRRSTEVGFAYNCEKDNPLILEPTNKKGRLSAVEKSLAEYDKRKNENADRLENVIVDVLDKADLSDDTLLIFVSKNFDQRAFEVINEKAKGYMSLVVVPAFRGETTQAEKIMSNENIKIYIKEVGRT
jgi:uncharacterized protein (DUF58 family)